MEKKYTYIYEFPKGLRQEPNMVVVKDVAHYANTHMTYIAKHSSWKLLVDQRGIVRLMFESKNNIWDTAISKESRLIDISGTVGIGPLYEGLLSMFMTKYKQNHNYLRVADTATRIAYIYNYSVQSKDLVIREIVNKIHSMRIGFVRLHTTPQGFAVVIGKDRKFIFSTLKKAVPPTTASYFISKMR